MNKRSHILLLMFLNLNEITHLHILLNDLSTILTTGKMTEEYEEMPRDKIEWKTKMCKELRNTSGESRIFENRQIWSGWYKPQIAPGELKIGLFSLFFYESESASQFCWFHLSLTTKRKNGQRPWEPIKYESLFHLCQLYLLDETLIMIKTSTVQASLCRLLRFPWWKLYDFSSLWTSDIYHQFHLTLAWRQIRYKLWCSQ